MKKLIFLLFPVFSYGQTTITVLTSDFQTGGLTNISGQTFVAGRLYVFFTGTSNDAGTVATVGISGTSQTWTEITSAGGVVNGGNRKRVQAFRFAPSSNNTNQSDFTYTGVQDGGWCILLEITGVVVTGTNGADAIVNNTVGSANGANPTLTLSTAILNRGSVVFGVANGRNPFAGTEESGWTEAVDGGYATPNTGAYLMYRISTTDNTPTVTSASDNWAGIAFELRASGRRATVIN